MYKQVIVVRTDIGMRKGKLAAQVAHAALSSFWKSIHSSEAETRRKASEWLADIQTKIVCKIDSEAELEAIATKAEALGLVVARIRDAGRTQLEPDTFTCVGIGPDTEERLEITGSLKLL